MKLTEQKCRIFILIIATLTLFNAVYADSTKIINPNNGHTYQRFDTPITWDTAKTACVNLGAHLATITNQSENDWIESNLAIGLDNIWLGGTDAGHEGTWTWITDEGWSYVNWNSGEPNNSGGNENYTIIQGKSLGKWNDGPATFKTQYLCEWESSVHLANVNLNGTLSLGNTPVCARVLANGVGGYSCDGTGSFTLNNVPTDNGQVTLFAWADSMIQHKEVIIPSIRACSH